MRGYPDRQVVGGSPITRLIKKGYLSSYKDGERKKYTATPLNTISSQLEDTLETFKNIVKLSALEVDKTQVRHFQGKTALGQVFKDILITSRLSKPNEILAISSADDVFSCLPEHDKDFMSRRIKQNTRIRWIAPKGLTAQTYASKERELRKMKFFDGKRYPFKIEMDIYGNKIALFDFNEKNPSAIIVQNKKLSQSVRSLFELLWDLLK